MASVAGLSPAQIDDLTGTVVEGAVKAGRPAVIELRADSCALGAPPEASKPPKMKKTGSFSKLMAAMKRKGSSSSLAEGVEVPQPGDR